MEASKYFFILSRCDFVTSFLSRLLSIYIICLSALLLEGIRPAGALERTYSLSDFPGHMVVLGEDNGDLAGFSTAAADLNGDGYSDIVLSSLGNDSSFGEDSGSIYIIFGGPQIESNSEVDLKIIGQANIIVYGKKTNYSTGFSMVTGDLNNDDRQDLIFGYGQYTEHYDPVFHYRDSYVQVLYGGAKFEAENFIYLAEMTYDTIYIGRSMGDNFGWSLSTADLTGDGIEDLAVGAPDYSDGQGAVHLLFGEENPTVPQSQDLRRSPAFCMLSGDAEGDFFGYDVAAGDLDGDGIGDLVVSSPDYSRNLTSKIGCIYIWYGPFRTSELNASGANTIIEGNKEFDTLGERILVKDLDADGIDELIVSCPGDDFLEGNRADNGCVYILNYQSEWRSGQLALGDVQARAQVWGESSSDYIGASLAVGDIDNDGRLDLLVGATRTGVEILENSGAVYLIGDLAGRTGDVGLSQADNIYKFAGARSEETVGASLACGDLNGDGHEDILIGAPGGGKTADDTTGKVYIFFGQRNFDFDVLFSSSPDTPEFSFSSGGGSSGGCFIATAAHGPTSSCVKKLGLFRDRILLPNKLGRAFTKLYYRLSPTPAEQISKFPAVASLCRALLAPAALLPAK